MKRTLYIDSTIPSDYFDERPEKQVFKEATRRWWHEEGPRFIVYTSDYVLIELNRGNYPNRSAVLELIRYVEPLETNDEIEAIAEVYMQEYVMPKGAAGDAFHLACASFYKVDYLLTWNCNHLANANKDQHIRIVNARLGLFTPRIVTPLELFRERNDI